MVHPPYQFKPRRFSRPYAPKRMGNRRRGRSTVSTDNETLTRPDATKALPDELIAKVFECMVETEVVRDMSPWKLNRSYKKWLPAATTCRRWRQIAFTDPTLWRVIDVGSIGTSLCMGLDFSSNATVDITFHDPAPIPFAIETLFKNAQRIERLIVVEMDQNTLRALTSLFWWTPMPALKELWVNTVPRTTDTDFTPFFKPELVPNLQTVQFTNLRFNWGTPIIRNLRALYLGRSPCQDVCRIDDFLRVMAKCYHLEFLKIDRAFPIRGEDESTLSIVLPQLRHVYLVADDPREIYQVLSHIHLDPSVNIDVHVRIDVDGPDHPFAHTSIADVIPQDAACIPLLRATTRAALKDFDFECWGPEGHGRLALTFDYIKIDDWTYSSSHHAKQFGDLLCKAPVTALTVHKDWSQPLPTSDLARLLRKFPHVTSFEYGGLKTTQTDLTRVLTPRLPCEGSMSSSRGHDSRTAVLPKLRTLWLTPTAGPQSIMTYLSDCLRARYRVGLFLDHLQVDLRAHERRPTKRDVKYRLREAENELAKLVRNSVQVRRV